MLLLVPIAACSEDDSPEGLIRDEVEDIAPGDAQGEDASGSYDLEAYTTACEGACGSSSSLLTISVCDVGNREDEIVDVDQEGGRLQVDGDASLFVSRMVGGLDADGSFEVGGYGTQAGGAVEATGRMFGEVSGEEVTGQLELWVRGRFDGQRVDCRARYDIEGTKRPEVFDD